MHISLLSKYGVCRLILFIFSDFYLLLCSKYSLYDPVMTFKIKGANQLLPFLFRNQHMRFAFCLLPSVYVCHQLLFTQYQSKPTSSWLPDISSFVNTGRSSYLISLTGLVQTGICLDDHTVYEMTFHFNCNFIGCPSPTRSKTRILDELKQFMTEFKDHGLLQGSHFFLLMKFPDFSSISVIFPDFFPKTRKCKLYLFMTSNEVIISS